MSSVPRNRERDLKRLAVQIAAQLPIGEGDALSVLDYARELVTGFLREKGTSRANVKPFYIARPG